MKTIKTLKTLMIIILLLVGYNQVGTTQDLESLSYNKRDSTLILIAKAAVLKYGPGYYRENIKPTIERGQVPKDGQQGGKDANRVYYWVTFYYDLEKEELEYNYASKVSIWADTGKPSIIMFGNGFGVNIPEVELRDSEKIQIPYQPGKSLKILPKKN
jgi:hypothetical protein